MTDRELLTLAAKAAGVFMRPDQWPFSDPMPDDATATYYDSDAQSITGARLWYGRNGEIGGTEDYTWSPLTDDADALRLAVRLGMVVHTTGNDLVGAHCPHLDFNAVSERVGGDKLAAVRRAIVRLAAEIGEKKPAPGGSSEAG